MLERAARNKRHCGLAPLGGHHQLEGRDSRGRVPGYGGGGGGGGSTVAATPESTVGATAAEGAVEATTREVMMQVGTATAATTMPVVAASEAVASVGEPATPTAEPQPQEGMDLDEAVQPFSIRIAFLDED
ncbi:hypothetical protein MTO96_048168 [Rhipicephalus appendiculatus]